MFDFFLSADGDDILLDVAADRAAALAQRLTMYKLRADVAISQTGLHVHRGTGAPPDGAMLDPRHVDLGWRRYSETAEGSDIDWDATEELGRKLPVPRRHWMTKHASHNCGAGTTLVE